MRARAFLSPRGQRSLLLVTMLACAFMAAALIVQSFFAWFVAFCAELVLCVQMARVRRELRVIRAGSLHAAEVVSVHPSKNRLYDFFFGQEVLVKSEFESSIRRFVCRSRKAMASGQMTHVAIDDFFGDNPRATLLNDDYWSYWAPLVRPVQKDAA